MPQVGDALAGGKEPSEDEVIAGIETECRDAIFLESAQWSAERAQLDRGDGGCKEDHTSHSQGLVGLVMKEAQQFERQTASHRMRDDIDGQTAAALTPVVGRPAQLHCERVSRT